MSINFKSLAGFAGLLCILASASGADWLRFRGPNGSGVAADVGVPISWSEGENIAWKAPLTGRGSSCPIVIGERIVLTSCSGYRQDRLHVVCFDSVEGKQIWERQLWATGRTMTHSSICPAAPTPVSDGERVFAYFSTNDLACFDLDGNLLWLRGLLIDYPNASNSLGLASSPLIVGDTLVVQIENDSQSIALALDASTGETRWALDRPTSANWTSPVLVERGDGQPPVVALQGSSGVSGHDPYTGDEVWRYDVGCSTIPSSVAQQGIVYVPSNGLTALRPRPGSVGPEVLWQNNRLGSSTPTPLVYQSQVFTVSGSVLKCADVNSGKVLWQLRLKGKFSGSPIAASDHVYLFNQSGEGQVVEIGDKRGRRVGGGALGETILCGPAIADQALYVRSDQHLWKIAK